eukprot:7252085-Pyramimonas_sp.AAC.1
MPNARAHFGGAGFNGRAHLRINALLLQCRACSEHEQSLVPFNRAATSIHCGHRCCRGKRTHRPRRPEAKQRH